MRAGLPAARSRLAFPNDLHVRARSFHRPRVSFEKVLRVRAWLSSAVSRDVFRYDLHARASLFLNVHKIRVDSDNKR